LDIFQTDLWIVAVFTHRLSSGTSDRKGCGKISKKIFSGSRSHIMMEYKGYFGKVEFDDEANIFYGEVINLRDVVTFQGETVMFHEYEPIISIPAKLIHRCLTIFEGDTENKHHRLFGFSKWLSLIAHQDPMQALIIAEIYLACINRTKPSLFDHENNLAQLMTRLFAEAEEREESDGGSMLQKVVSLQDMMLTLRVDGVNDWLKAAERP
jgi:hypothetical protein